MKKAGFTQKNNIGQVQPDNLIKCHSRVSLSGISTLVYRLGVSPTGAASKPWNSSHLAGELSALHPSYKACSGFTLIELLVVVLIIGILAAVAVPQYRVAVKKAQLARFIPVAKAIGQAQDAYQLANGTYTTDLTLLDVEVPAGCTPTSTANKVYDCGNSWQIGVYDGPTNVQVGDSTIHYVYSFASHETYNRKRGDILCVSRGEVSRKVCRTLGPGEEKEDIGWDYIYTLQ